MTPGQNARECSRTRRARVSPLAITTRAERTPESPASMLEPASWTVSLQGRCGQNRRRPMRRLVPTIAAGLVSGFLVVVFAVSYAALISAGELEAFLPQFIGITLVSAVLTGGIVAALSIGQTKSTTFQLLAQDSTLLEEAKARAVAVATTW